MTPRLRLLPPAPAAARALLDALTGRYPRVLRQFSSAEAAQKNHSDGTFDGEHRSLREEPLSPDLDDAELITSACAATSGGIVAYAAHAPVLDLDFDVKVVPSATPGHSHLYLNKPLSWSEYARLLQVLADVGIIEPGYAAASIARGYSAVRVPWRPKPKPAPPPPTPPLPF